MEFMIAFCGRKALNFCYFLILLLIVSFGSIVAFEVNVAVDYGFNETDSTSMLQDAINSGASKVIIPNMGKDWIVNQTINIASNQEIILEPGVVIAAKRGCFKGRKEPLINVENKENVLISGYGATLKMHKEDYMGASYEKAEWRHTLQLLSSEDVEVVGITCRDSGGDGIYIGVSSGHRAWCENIEIRDVVCDNNYRQGISIISARNLLIENCIFRNTGGTAPQAGVDFEPNNATQILSNCFVKNCVSEANQGPGFVVHPTNLKNDSEDLSIRFENCVVKGCSSGFVFNGPYKDGPGGFIELVNCTIEQANTGFAIRYKDKFNARIRFVDCVILDSATPISFTTGNVERTKCVGGVDFINLEVVHKSTNPFINVLESSTSFGIYDVEGKIVVKSPYPASIDLGATDPDEFRVDYSTQKMERDESYTPVFLRKATIPNESMALRYEGLYLFYASKGEEIQIDATCRKLGKNEDTLRVIITSPSGEYLYDVEIVPRGTKEVIFKASETGVYTIACHMKKNAFEVNANKSLGFVPSKGKVNLVTPSGYVYFWLPKGLLNADIKVEGQGSGERVKATLFNSKGKNVEEKDNISGLFPHNFKINLDKPSEGELWSMLLEKPSEGTYEDVTISFDTTIPTISFSPGLVFGLK